jgi:hypothetical protein
MLQNTLAKKLQLKPGYQAIILNAPPGYIEQLGFKAASRNGAF